MARRATKREREYQPGLKDRIRDRFPGCLILKNDTSQLQGIPDLLILYRDRWAILEVKRERPTCAEDFEPNQEYYLELLNEMSFAACIFPENEEEVLNDLALAFES